MKKKLTKNDSISAVVKDFDVLVAAFEALLNKHDVHQEYFSEFARCHSYSDKVDIYREWKRWANDGIPTCWIDDAFIWKNTKCGSEFWNLIAESWKLYYNLNLKK